MGSIALLIVTHIDTDAIYNIFTCSLKVYFMKLCTNKGNQLPYLGKLSDYLTDKGLVNKVVERESFKIN